MSDLKFNCEVCGQPILVDANAAGRKLVCPSCKTALLVPKGPPAAPRPPAVVKPRVIPVPTSTPPRARTPEKPAEPTPTSAPRRLPETARKPGARPKPATETASSPTLVTGLSSAPRTPPPEPAPQPVQVAVLTSEIKRDVIRSARDLLADPARWMSGVDPEGKLAYAAKEAKGKLKRVEVGSEEATRHSLMGAVLLELHRLNVTPTAIGRTEFLDNEIPAAIRKVIHGETPAAGGESPPESTAPALMSISHGQCLELLDLLEGEYAHRSVAGPDSNALREIRGVTLEDLLVRAARDEVMTTPELLRAVHHELMEIDRRLSALERV